MGEKFGEMLEEIRKVAAGLDLKREDPTKNYESCGYQVILAKSRGTGCCYSVEIVIPVFIDALSKEKLATGVDYPKMYVGDHQFTINGMGKDRNPEVALREALKDVLGKIEILRRGF